MNKKRKIIIICVIIFIAIFSISTIAYFKYFNKEKPKQQNIVEEIEETKNKDDVNVDSNLELNQNEENLEDSNETILDEKEEQKPISTPKPSKSPIQSTTTNNTSSNSTSTPTETPKPSETPTPIQSSSPVPSETPKPSPTPTTDNKKSDLQEAIDYHLSTGDKLTYKNGIPLTLEQCRELGNIVYSRQETSYVYRYSCKYTDNETVTVAGLKVKFIYNDIEYYEYYDDYYRITNQTEDYLSLIH